MPDEPIPDLSLVPGFTHSDFLRLIDKLVQLEGHWLWRGYAAEAHGYPVFEWGGRDGMVTQVHRLSYLLFRGPIPDGYHIDHLCKVRGCWRPDHLEAVTPGENARRALVKTECIRGHQ